jgi:hypothetical protein
LTATVLLTTAIGPWTLDFSNGLGRLGRFGTAVGTDDFQRNPMFTGLGTMGRQNYPLSHPPCLCLVLILVPACHGDPSAIARTRVDGNQAKIAQVNLLLHCRELAGFVGTCRDRNGIFVPIYSYLQLSTLIYT